MPASTTSLTVLAPPGDETGPTWDEQASDVSPGNSFLNDGHVFLYARNTTVDPLELIFESDMYGAELEVLRVTVPGSGDEHGVKVFGPFPPGLFNDHGATDSAKTGAVMVRQATGNDGDVLLCPFAMNFTLRSHEGVRALPGVGGGVDSGTEPPEVIPFDRDIDYDGRDFDADESFNAAYDDLDPVPLWANKGDLGAAADASQATSSAQPTYRAGGALLGGHDYAAFDGGDYLRTAPLASALAQPNVIASVTMWTTTAGSNFVHDGVVNRHGLRNLSTSTALNITAGTDVGTGQGLTLNTWHMLQATFDGGSSSLRLDGAAGGAVSAGADSLDALTIGASNTGTSPIDGAVARVIVCGTVPAASAVDSYLEGVYEEFPQS